MSSRWASSSLRSSATSEQAHQLASLIPDARFVPLDSRNHLLRADEPAWQRFLDEVDAFLGEGPAP